MSLRASFRPLVLLAALVAALPACGDQGAEPAGGSDGAGGEDARAGDTDALDAEPDDDATQADAVEGALDAEPDAQPEDVAEPDAQPELPPVDTCTIQPTLSSLETDYFSKSCAFSGSCHNSAGAKGAGNLDLSPGKAWAALVNVPSKHGAGKVRVVPGDPDASFLVHKLEGPAKGEGNLMPWGAQLPVDPDCRIRRVREWIAAGAKND